ncbi:MAG: stage II sporulation protein M [Candidatus Hodarchaeota archaeon]
MSDLAFNGIKGASRKIFKALMRTRSPYFSKPFIYTLIVSAIIIFVSLTYGASRGNQVEPDVANQTLTEVETIAGESTWFSIFINNVSIVLATFIPLIGAVWMIFVQFNTGWYLGAMAKALDVDYMMFTSVILITPVGLIEYIAYIIALGESMLLVYSATQGEFKERLIQHSWKSIVIVVSLLLIAGVIEAFLLGRL